MTTLRKGFGKTPEDDVLVALGYPHIVVGTDQSMPVVTADTVFRKFPLDTTHLPRVFLPRYFEAVGCASDDDDLRKALATEPPRWTPARLATAVQSLLGFGTAYELFLLEAMVGSAVVAEALTTALEAVSTKEWDGAGGALDSAGYSVVNAMYFVLLRVPAPLRTKLRARLEKLFAKGKKYLGGRPMDALDVALHGRVGVERSGYRDDEGTLFQDLVYADDDLAWVTKVALEVLARLKPGDRAPFDLRLAFLGGPKVLAAMSTGSKFHATTKAAMKRQLARIR